MSTLAPLPPTYAQAKLALTQCDRLDECKDWADKAAALAAYAKQADDKSLVNMAIRIRARAIRRSGELLKEIDARGEHRRTDGADSSSPSQREAAEQAGMSERQQVTAVRVANVPEDEFEAAVESDTPPTISALADKGRKRNLVDLGGRTPEAFNRALHFVALFERIAGNLETCEPERALPCLLPDQRNEWIGYVARIERVMRTLSRINSEAAARSRSPLAFTPDPGVTYRKPMRLDSIDGSPVKTDLPQPDVDRILGKRRDD